MELTKVCLPASPTTTETVDFTLRKRTTFRIVFKFKNPDGTPLPINGKIITFHIESENGNEILTIDSQSITPNGSTIIVTNNLGGVVDVLITDEETSVLNFIKAKWWVTLTLLNGDVFLRGRGSIYLKEPYED